MRAGRRGMWEEVDDAGVCCDKARRSWARLRSGVVEGEEGRRR